MFFLGPLQISDSALLSSRSSILPPIKTSQEIRVKQVNYFFSFFRIWLSWCPNGSNRPCGYANTCSCLSDGDNYGCPVAPWAAVRPVWDNMLSAGMRCYHSPGLLNLQLPHTRAHTHTHAAWSLMKPTCSGMISPGSSLSPMLQALCPISLSVFAARLGLLQKHRGDTAELHGLNVREKLPILPPSHHPDRINKSALWTSVSACIMDDIAEGPARQRGWVPGRDNEPPFSRGKCGEALVTSISNLSKSETQLTANGPMRMEGRLELLKKWI